MQTLVTILSVTLGAVIVGAALLVRYLLINAFRTVTATIEILERGYPGISITFSRMKGRIVSRAFQQMQEHDDYKALRNAVSHALASLQIMHDTARKSNYTWVAKDADEIMQLFKTFR